MSVPATIRNANPGAIWPSPTAERWGATGAEQLTDAQRNQMAVFPGKVSGAAAQFDLLSRKYVGMSLQAALSTWSGGNHVDTYVQRVCEVTGLARTDTLTAEYIRTPKTAIRLARAMARHETGWDLGEYPMTQAEWQKAHALALSQDRPVADTGNALGEAIARWCRQQIGKGEKAGPGNYEYMDDWYRALGLEPLEDGATPWCELFALNAWRNGGAIVTPPDDPLILMARNHRKLGTPVSHTSDIQIGDAAIWPRPSAGPSAGHVGIAVEVDRETQRACFAEGNVGNKVVVKWYSFDYIDEHALDLRRPQRSRAMPNGLKPVFTTIKDSPSLKSLVNGIAGTVSAIGAWFATAVGLMPDAVANAEQAVSTTQRGVSLLSIAIIPGTLTVLALGAFVFSLVRGISQRRSESGFNARRLTLEVEPRRQKPARPRKRPKAATKAKSKDTSTRSKKRKVRNAR